MCLQIINSTVWSQTSFYFTWHLGVPKTMRTVSPSSFWHNFCDSVSKEWLLQYLILSSLTPHRWGDDLKYYQNISHFLYSSRQTDSHSHKYRLPTLPHDLTTKAIAGISVKFNMIVHSLLITFGNGERALKSRKQSQNNTISKTRHFFSQNGLGFMYN